MTAITNRDEIQEGDIVTYGALGYIHTGTMVSGATLNANSGEEDYDSEALFALPGMGTWYSDFISAERPKGRITK